MLQSKEVVVGNQNIFITMLQSAVGHSGYPGERVGILVKAYELGVKELFTLIVETL